MYFRQGTNDFIVWSDTSPGAAAIHFSSDKDLFQVADQRPYKPSKIILEFARQVVMRPVKDRTLTKGSDTSTVGRLRTAGLLSLTRPCECVGMFVFFIFFLAWERRCLSKEHLC